MAEVRGVVEVMGWGRIEGCDGNEGSCRNDRTFEGVGLFLPAR